MRINLNQLNPFSIKSNSYLFRRRQDRRALNALRRRRADKKLIVWIYRPLITIVLVLDISYLFPELGLSDLHDIDPCHGHHRHCSLLVRVKRHHGCQPVQGEDLVALKMPGNPLDRETNKWQILRFFKYHILPSFSDSTCLYTFFQTK